MDKLLQIVREINKEVFVSAYPEGYVPVSLPLMRMLSDALIEHDKATPSAPPPAFMVTAREVCSAGLALVNDRGSRPIHG